MEPSEKNIYKQKYNLQVPNVTDPQVQSALYNQTKGEQKQKYRGMFETQKSGNKTSLGDIGLNIRTLLTPKVGQD